jgi:glycosyltransferase 2 family protein
LFTRLTQVILGLGCAAVLLWLALARIDLHETETALATANPIWIALGIAAYAINLLIRAVRWRLILRQVEKVAFGPMLSALVVGYGVNALLPARLGELFRVEFCKQRYRLPRIWVLSSIVIERLLDGIVVILCLGLGLLISYRSDHITKVLGGLMAIGTAIFGGLLFATLIMSGKSIPRLFERWPAISGRMDMVRSGLEIVRSRRLPIILTISLLVYVPDTLSIWLAVKAVGISLSFGNTLVLAGAASLATLLPSGPAFLGALQLAYALTMQFAGEPASLGIAATILVQVFYYAPVALIAVLLIASGAGHRLRNVFNSHRTA